MPQPDLTARARSAGYWTAYVADVWPATRTKPANPRVLRIPGTFPSENAALAAARDAIAYGWVAEHIVRRETAKACADFNLPREIINEIGRHLDNALEGEKADG
jgi:hypothetical protein